MEYKYGIRIFCIILQFLTSSSIACLRKSGERPQPFSFYFLEGSYYVFPAPIIKNMDTSLTACTNMEKPYVIGTRKHLKKVGGQCIIPFEQHDCEAPQLEGPSGYDFPLIYDKIKSFKLCSWKDLPDSSKVSSPSPSKRRYTLYEYPNFYVKVLELKGVEECTDLPDNKVSSVETHGNCLYLFSSSNCQGERFKVSQTTRFNYNLSVVGWDNKARSIKACGLSLQGRIAKFRPTSEFGDLRLDYDLEKLPIADTKSLINSGTSPKDMPYNEERTLNETFQFEWIGSLSELDSVEVEDDLNVNGGLCFPLSETYSGCEQVYRLKNALTEAYQFHSRNESQDKTTTVQRFRKFSVRQQFKVPACSTLEISSFILVKKNVPIDFILGIRISGENNGKRMKTIELQKYLSEEITYLGDLNEFEIFAKASGRFLACVGMRADFVKKERNMSDCKEPTATSETPTLLPKKEQFKDVEDDLYTPDHTEKLNPDSSQREGQVGTNSSNQSGGKIDLAQIMKEYQVYFIVMGVLFLCTIYIIFCVRRSNDIRRRTEFEVLTLGRNVLTIQFLCCSRRH